MPEKTSPKNLRVIVIGAGMAGILSAIKLREAGFSKLSIYEKAERVGGTWRENRYPGLTCDVPSHAYNFTFEPNPDWSHRFPPGPEIQQYFEDTTKKYGIDEHIHFNQAIVSCEHREDRWRIETENGVRDEADVVIAATGVLHHPNLPDIEGLGDFQGSLFHTARWDRDVPLDGRRIGVIGNGSTGIQIVSALASRARALYQFQRTAQWIMPSENPRYSEEEKAAFRSNPEQLAEVKERVDSGPGTAQFANAITNPDSEEMQAIEDLVLSNLEENVRDSQLREKLRPNYRAACKRLVISPDYYQAIQHPNAELVTEGIRRVEAKGIRLENGRLIEVDVLALATGFRADRFIRPIRLIGRGGADLDDVWAKRPHAYLSISIPDFPNFFMLNGPNGPVGNFSLIDIAERQMSYIEQLIGLLRSGRCREVSVTRAAMDRFDEERMEAAKSTIWATGCRSWYLDAEGIPASWPWSQGRFREEMASPRLEDYELLR